MTEIKYLRPELLEAIARNTLRHIPLPTKNEPTPFRKFRIFSV